MSTPAERLGIRETARRSGLSPSALRYYEKVGLLPPPARASNRRQYDPAVLDRLIVITTARRAGLTLAEIRDLLDGLTSGAPAGDAWRSQASAKLPEVDRLLQDLTVARALLQAVAGCVCSDLTECASLLRRDRYWPELQPLEALPPADGVRAQGPLICAPDRTQPGWRPDGRTRPDS